VLEDADRSIATESIAAATRSAGTDRMAAAAERRLSRTVCTIRRFYRECA
jgi:hypothetical protein